MTNDTDVFHDQRTEPREVLGRYHRVEFLLSPPGPAYMFKLRDLSSKGMGIIVRRDSAVLRALRVGDVMEMHYFEPDGRIPAERLRTEIRHITGPDKDGPLQDHSMVGLMILGRQPLEAKPAEA